MASSIGVFNPTQLPAFNLYKSRLSEPGLPDPSWAPTVTSPIFPGEIRHSELLGAVSGQRVAPQYQAAYGRAINAIGGLGLSKEEQRLLLQNNPDQPHLRALLAQDQSRAGIKKVAQPQQAQQGIIQKLGIALRTEIEKVGEKCVKVANNLSKAAKEFAALPKLAAKAPLLGSLAQAIGVLGNGLRGATGNNDPKQMAMDFAKAVKELIKLLEKTALKKLLKSASKLVPVLGEATLAWDIYTSARKAEQASKRGDKAAAAAWGAVCGLNNLAMGMRITCDLAMAVTALTAGTASAATIPMMGGCEAVVGVLAGIAEVVAIGLD